MMADGTTLTLPEPISAQRNGIILVWSRYNPDTGASFEYGWNYSYIPKDSVTQNNDTTTTGHSFFLTGESLGYVASKYLYISDTEIKGSTNNANNGVEGSGITTRNRNFALRQVLSY